MCDGWIYLMLDFIDEVKDVDEELASCINHALKFKWHRDHNMEEWQRYYYRKWFKLFLFVLTLKLKLARRFSLFSNLGAFLTLENFNKQLNNPMNSKHNQFKQLNQQNQQNQHQPFSLPTSTSFCISESCRNF